MTSNKIFYNNLCFSNESKFPRKRPHPKLLEKTDFSLTVNPIFIVQFIYIYIYIHTYIHRQIDIYINRELHIYIDR